MIDRFHDFSDAELHELRYGLRLNYMHASTADQERIATQLSDEIGALQEQREMARRREELPG